MAKPRKSVSTFINPTGLIEQHYVGRQTGITVGIGVREVNRLTKKLLAEDKKPLILVDLSKVTHTNFRSHMAAARGMRKVPYHKIAAYGPDSMQILINILAIVSDKKTRVRAFSNRFEALEWLKGKG